MASACASADRPRRCVFIALVAFARGRRRGTPPVLGSAQRGEVAGHGRLECMQPVLSLTRRHTQTFRLGARVLVHELRRGRPTARAPRPRRPAATRHTSGNWRPCCVSRPGCLQAARRPAPPHPPPRPAGRHGDLTRKPARPVRVPPALVSHHKRPFGHKDGAGALPPRRIRAVTHLQRQVGQRTRRQRAFTTVPGNHRSDDLIPVRAHRSSPKGSGG